MRQGKIHFPMGNKIRYLQDFGIHEGLPSGIDFDVEILAARPGEQPGDRVRLRARGYGYCYPNYGNGAIYLTRGSCGWGEGGR